MSKRKDTDSDKHVKWNDNVQVRVIPSEHIIRDLTKAAASACSKKLLNILQSMPPDEAADILFSEKKGLKQYLLQHFFWSTHQEAIKGNYVSNEFKKALEYFMQLNFDQIKEVFYDITAQFRLNSVDDSQIKSCNLVLDDFKITEKNFVHTAQNLEKHKVSGCDPITPFTSDEDKFSLAKTSYSSSRVESIKRQKTNNNEYTASKNPLHKDLESSSQEEVNVESNNIAIRSRAEGIKTEEQNKPSIESTSSTIDHQTHSSPSSEAPTSQRSAVVGSLTERFQHQAQENIKKKIHQDDILVSLNIKNKNSNSVHNHSNPEQKNSPSLYDLVNDFAWLEDLPKFMQKMFPHLLESLNESAKYIKEVFDLKSSKQALFNGNQNDSSSTSNDYDLEDNISEAVSLLNTPSNNYIEMGMILADATVNYDILPVDIGLKILNDNNMLGLQQEFLAFY